MFVWSLAHGHPVAVDLPDRLTLKLGFFNLKHMVPAAAFHILWLLQKPDQFQPTEMEGGKGVFNAGLKQQLSIPDAAQFKNAADHGAVILHTDTSLQLAVCLVQKFLTVYNDAGVGAASRFLRIRQMP